MAYEVTCANWKKAVAALVRHTGQTVDPQVLTILEKEMGASTNMSAVWRRMQALLAEVGEVGLADQVSGFSGPLIANDK